MTRRTSRRRTSVRRTSVRRNSRSLRRNNKKRDRRDYGWVAENANVLVTTPQGRVFPMTWGQYVRNVSLSDSAIMQMSHAMDRDGAVVRDDGYRIELVKMSPNSRRSSRRHLRRNGVVQPLYGYDSMSNAYNVADYPYGRTVRTQIRYWLESHPKHGFRFVSQTVNPKNGLWNKPKASTYADFAAAMYLDEKGHVTWTGLGMYSDANKVVEFVNDFPGADKSILKQFVPAKVRHLQKMVKTNELGESGWLMNGVPVPLTEADAHRNREELAQWQAVAATL